MKYKGIYNIFEQSLVKTFLFDKNSKRVSFDDFLKLSEVKKMKFDLSDEIKNKIEKIAEHIYFYRKNNKPVIFFTGAHMIKNGLGLILINLIEKNIVTLVAGNCATTIHDFELALLGKTGENVSESLSLGKFGMEAEFGIMNDAISVGDKYGLGFGETLGKMICEKSYYNKIKDRSDKDIFSKEFKYPKASVLGACYREKVPFTAHVSIGTDVIDQLPNFDGCSKGRCSARDFLIFVNEVTNLNKGGVFLNVGSAVMGPEVFLKAVSIASNTGMSPNGLITANFDLRKECPSSFKKIDESNPYYYFRDQKSVVSRIPDVFEGESFYVEGNIKQTVPLLYLNLMKVFSY